MNGTVFVGIIDTFPVPKAFTLTKVKVSLLTLPAGANLLVDVKKNGTSILSATLAIATTDTAINGVYTVSTGDSGKATISTSAFVENDKVELSITQVGSSVAGSDFTIQLIA